MAKNNRIEIRADEEFMGALNSLANETGKTRADVIRDALNLYRMVINERLKHNNGIVFKSLNDHSEGDRLRAIPPKQVREVVNA